MGARGWVLVLTNESSWFGACLSACLGAVWVCVWVRVLTNGSSWFSACLDACRVCVGCVGREGSREGRVRKWRGEREEVDRVGEMVIENDIVYFVLLLNKRTICK